MCEKITRSSQSLSKVYFFVNLYFYLTEWLVAGHSLHDPVHEVAGLCVHPGVAGPAAPDAPADHTNALSAAHEGAATVALLYIFRIMKTVQCVHHQSHLA